MDFPKGAIIRQYDGLKGRRWVTRANSRRLLACPGRGTSFFFRVLFGIATAFPGLPYYCCLQHFQEMGKKERGRWGRMGVYIGKRGLGWSINV